MTIRELLEKSGTVITEEQAQAMEKYNDLVLRKNLVMNLTAVREKEASLVKNVCDSLTAYEEDCFPERGKYLDLGTGAGFPGMILAILRPDMMAVLLDSLEKRLRFIESAAEEIKVENVRVIHMRAEDGGRRRKLREQFDVVTARAVKTLPILLEWALPFVKPGGVFIAMKGPLAEEELKQSERALKVLSGKLEKKKDMVLPDGSRRCILYIRKTGPCDKIYPRKPGIAEKNPLI